MTPEPYYLSAADFAGNHSRDPQTFIVNGPRGERYYYRAENYGGSAYAAEQAAIHAMKGFNQQPKLPKVSAPCWTLDQLLGSEGKRP